ncbi:unnamed protein product, partial [Meganyctiphanes norvegica]
KKRTYSNESDKDMFTQNPKNQNRETLKKKRKTPIKKIYLGSDSDEEPSKKKPVLKKEAKKRSHKDKDMFVLKSKTIRSPEVILEENERSLGPPSSVGSPSLGGSALGG